MKIAIKVYKKNSINWLYTVIVPSKQLATALKSLDKREVSFLAVELR